MLRDAYLHKMTEQQWDVIMRVHLKGHWAPLRHAVDHWRARSKGGEQVNGGEIAECAGWHELDPITTQEPWSIDTIAERLAGARA